MSFKRKHGYIQMTIERWLRNYAEAENHIKRHETLWHEWNHNKQWLSHVQELILPSFPSYSQHGLSHSESVIRNIEMLLGEGNIRSLSATDCFALLHTVYIHDIGMCITHTDRKEIIKNEKFHDFLRTIRQSTHEDMARYADYLLQVCFDEPVHMNDKERLDYILEQKLNIYYAVTYLVAEFRRIEHGDISRRRLEEWIGEPSKLGAGFSAMEIPDRIFYVIAECAEAHTKWSFDAILSLPAEDTGYALDYIHPRFIAVLLQLGDALDMDNDRFHPLVNEYLGSLPSVSAIHYGKHRAIRSLHITNQKVSIKADCRNQDELRLVRQECDNIQNIIEKASYHWAVIRPRNSKVSLPTLDSVEIFLNGNLIPGKLITARFEISQDKAFKLLQGNNFYRDTNFVFLRELLQNAVDASKIQYYHVYRRSMKYIDDGGSSNPADVAKLVSPLNYPIEIEFYIVRVKDGKYINFSENVPEHDDVSEKECGILIRVKDCGTGIRASDIEQIIEVGSSYERRRTEVRKMPKWLQPTGVFGIGLQSVFLVCDKLKAVTYTHNEESYEILFYPRTGGSEGYVNVMPLAKEHGMIPYGTSFEMFISNEKRRSHADSPETWDGTDPFTNEYDKKSDIRHARELVKQMGLYLAEIVGEPLFPITLKIYDPSLRADVLYKTYDNSFKDKFLNLNLEIYSLSYGNWVLRNSDSGKRDRAKISWAYDIEKKKYVYFDKGNAFWLNVEEAKLYIWNSRHNAYARLGIDRIMAMRERYRNSNVKDDVGERMQVYYKGILLSKTSFCNDASLIEYIDLKETMNGEYLKLDRNGLSEEGYDYLEIVYRDMIRSAREALRFYGAKKKNSNEYPECIKEIEKNINRLYENLFREDDFGEKDVECAERYFLSVTALAYFVMVEKKDDYLPSLKEYDLESWDHLLTKLSEKMECLKELFPDKDDVRSYWKNSFLHNIPVWGRKGKPPHSPIDIVDFIQNKNKFAILSFRENRNKAWNECLIWVDPERYKDELLCNIIALRDQFDLDHRRNIDRKILSFAEPVMNRKYQESEKRNLESERKSHLVFKWMLDNIPSIAVFSSLDGRIRMNVLDAEVTGSLYLDQNMKKLTLERMIETYSNEHVERFSTIVWTGYHYLSLNKMPPSIKYVKRGKLSDSESDKMIFPLSGKNLKKLIQECDQLLDPVQDFLQELYDNIVSGVYDHIREKIENIPDDDGAIDGRFWTLLENQFLQSEEEKKKNDQVSVFRDLRNEAEQTVLSEKDQDAVAEALILSGEPDGQVLKTYSHYGNACKVLRKTVKYYASILLPQKQLERYGESTEFKNMTQYVAENSIMPLSAERVKLIYRLYIYECMFAYLYWKKKNQFQSYHMVLRKLLEEQNES